MDEGWAKNTRDPFTPNPTINLTELIKYGKDRNVKIVLWLPWLTVENHFDLFKTFADWGIAGVKIDFMDRSDQWMVNYYERVAKEAAKHKLFVDFHGAFKPAGLERKYPNVLSYEGVLGMEQGGNCKPENSIYLPFMRNAVGPMDFTPGSMISAQPEDNRSTRANAMGSGTRAFQMALFIIFESGLQMLADNPVYYYRELPCTEFITSVPVTWDETKVLLKTPVTEAPPVQASQYIEQATKQSVAFRNCGVSGTTTLDFLPIAERQFPNVKSAAQELSQRKGTLLFSIMLGTNDSACNGPFGSPVEPVSYYTNMKAIIDELLSLYPECKVVIHQPIWYSPNTYNGAMYLAAGLKINIAIALFYAFYRLFFYRDTFFQWRRTALLCFLVISPLYPVLNIQEWIRSHEPMVAMVDLYATIVLPEIEITPEVRAADWQSIILSTVNIIYWSGVTLLLVRFFAQLASILRLRLRCRKDQIEGIPVYLLDKESGPFSFFHWIGKHFLSPGSQSYFTTSRERHSRTARPRRKPGANRIRGCGENAGVSGWRKEYESFHQQPSSLSGDRPGKRNTRPSHRTVRNSGRRHTL